MHISVAIGNQKCFSNISHILATYFISFLENKVTIKLTDLIIMYNLIMYNLVNYVYLNLEQPGIFKDRGGFLE